MSGGHFNYTQFQIQQIADEIKQLIIDNDSDETNEFGDPKGAHYTPATIAEFKTALNIMKRAYVYAQRIDWLVSGDDREDSFHKRLHDELNKLDFMR